MRVVEGSWRKLALYGLALAALTLVIQIATILSYTFAADRLENEIAARGQSGGPARAAGFGPVASLLFEAIRSTPNVELTRLDWRADGSLAASLRIDTPATLAALRARAEASGLQGRGRRGAERRCRRSGGAAVNGLSAWWATRSIREQRLLAVMFGLIALVLVWLLVIRPLGDALDRAKQRHNTAVLALAEARARSNPGGARTGATPPLPLDALISRTAADAGFTAARVTGGGADDGAAHARRGPAAGAVRLDRDAGGTGGAGRTVAGAGQSGPDGRGRGGVQRPGEPMKIRMPFGRFAFAVAVFFFALVALTPLGLAIRWFGLDTRGLAAREAEGSVWLGALKEAQLGPAPIGDVSARLEQPAALPRPGAGVAGPRRRDAALRGRGDGLAARLRLRRRDRAIAARRPARAAADHRGRASGRQHRLRQRPVQPRRRAGAGDRERRCRRLEPVLRAGRQCELRRRCGACCPWSGRAAWSSSTSACSPMAATGSNCSSAARTRRSASASSRPDSPPAMAVSRGSSKADSEITRPIRRRFRTWIVGGASRAWGLSVRHHAGTNGGQDHEIYHYGSGGSAAQHFGIGGDAASPRACRRPRRPPSRRRIPTAWTRR